MNEHFNKVIGEYRYKSKKNKISQFFPSKMGDSFIGYTKNGIKCTFIKHNYRPYFIYRLFWYLRYTNPIIKFNIPRKRHITLVVLMVITIIAMFVIAYYF